MEEKVTISKKEYEELLENQMWVNALEAAGVDNWMGYGDAVDIFEEYKSEEGEDI